MEKDEFLWDWLKHENLILNTRSSIFVVGEIVLLGYATTQGSQYPFFFLGLGIILTMLWLLVNFGAFQGQYT